jgi:hypothetical protein
MSTKGQQYNSPYLLQLLNIIFQYKSEFQFLSILFKMLVTFLPRKPKLLMKYFILIFSYIIKILSNNII